MSSITKPGKSVATLKRSLGSDLWDTPVSFAAFRSVHYPCNRNLGLPKEYKIQIKKEGRLERMQTVPEFRMHMSETPSRVLSHSLRSRMNGAAGFGCGPVTPRIAPGTPSAGFVIAVGEDRPTTSTTALAVPAVPAESLGSWKWKKGAPGNAAPPPGLINFRRSLPQLRAIPRWLCSLLSRLRADYFYFKVKA